MIETWKFTKSISRNTKKLNILKMTLIQHKFQLYVFQKVLSFYQHYFSWAYQSFPVTQFSPICPKSILLLFDLLLKHSLETFRHFLFNHYYFLKICRMFDERCSFKTVLSLRNTTFYVQNVVTFWRNSIRKSNNINKLNTDDANFWMMTYGWMTNNFHGDTYEWWRIYQLLINEIF